MAIEQFDRRIEAARRKAAEAEDPRVAEQYEHHADLLESVASMLAAQQRLIDRKNESLEALTELIETFHREYGHRLDDEAADQLDRVAAAAGEFRESLEAEQGRGIGAVESDAAAQAGGAVDDGDAAAGSDAGADPDADGN